MRDLRNALPTLRRNFGFSCVVILTLALGIGANTAIFTVVNGVVVKPLPYPEPDRLLMLWENPFPTVEARPTIVLRFSFDPAGGTSALRKAVSDIDTNVAIDRIETMKQIVYGSVAESRFRTGLLVVFALLALFVAFVGLCDELFGKSKNARVRHPNGVWRQPRCYCSTRSCLSSEVGSDWNMRRLGRSVVACTTDRKSSLRHCSV